MWKLKIAEGGGPWLTTTNGHIGRQHWEFDPDAGTAEERAEVEKVREEFKKNRFRRQQSADLLMRMQLAKENSPSPPMPAAAKVEETEDVTEEALITTIKRGLSFFSTIQACDGHWPAETAGPSFYLPPLVLALYITGTLNTVLSSEHQKEMIRYLYNHQNEDGGWGLHIEGNSIMFGSVLSYVALRILGEGPEDGDDMAMAKARRWILSHGGAVAIPSLGKFWLSVLGVYDWAGCNPIPPEMWLMPNYFPIHPARMACYCRLVYLPMSYLYGKKFVGTITELVHALRDELFVQPHCQISWNNTRYTCAKEDLYYPHPLVQDLLWGFLHHFGEPVLTRWPFSTLRKKALETTMELIHYEDENSRYFCIGVVIKVLCLLACWVEDPQSKAFKRHIARLPDYFWVAEDGLKLQSFGSQSWDAALAIQAIFHSNLAEEYAPMLKKAHDFMKASQVRDNPSGNFTKMNRHITKGGWTFSIKDHGWQAVDCTAEGLKVVLLLAQMPSELVGDKIETGRLYDAVELILSLQGKDGGFRVWEPQRAYGWMEMLNPTELFGDPVVERGYVECNSSVIQALVLFKKLHPGHRESEIERCISKGLAFIEDEQEQDGSWYGRWGTCYTYATWFAVEGLVACGKNYNNSPALRKACKFLLSKQLPDGGWGESYLSSANEEYTNLEGNRSNLVQTSWALLALIAAGQVNLNPTPICRGIRLLINSQMEDGDFPQQETTGIFFKSCALHFAIYRNVFPIWALGEFRRSFIHA